MSQFNPALVDTDTGSGHVTNQNSALAAILTKHSGSSRPSYAVAGLRWLKNSVSPWEIYEYDGTDDILIGRIDPTNNRIHLAEFSATLASASTVNIYGAAAKFIEISGTTTIAAFDTAPAGTVIRTRFAGILTLTHNGTSFIMLGASSITTAAGDVAVWKSEGSGNWRMINFIQSNGYSLGFADPILDKASPGTIGGTTPAALSCTTLSSTNITDDGSSVVVENDLRVADGASGGFLGAGDQTTLTISSGSVTATKSYHTIEGEGGVADDLVTINGGSSGDILVIRAVSSSFDITAKDGSGNLFLAGDFVMDINTDMLTLMKSGSSWFELSRSNNGV